jgi:alkylation response protein AidB-like acyl-CoA dehydrogenase
MWQNLSSDQSLLRDTTARFLADQVPLSQQRKDRHDPAGFYPQYWKSGAEIGWTSLLVAEEHGGGSVSGRGPVDVALIAYEFGRHAAPGPLVDCNVVASALSGQQDEQLRAVLAELIAGSSVAGYCLGAAPWRTAEQSALRIRRQGADLLIDGTLGPVESATVARYLLVSAQGDSGPTQVLIEAGSPGITISPLKGIDVSRRFASIKFDQVRAPASALLGAFGQAGAQLSRQIQEAAVILCAEAVGAMDAAFEMTVEWAFNRYTFGRALASYQALKHRFADMKSWLEASHAISDAAADAVADNAPLAADTCSAAKAYVGERGPELTQECVQLFGGIGVTYDHDLHFFLRRVTLNRLLYGTPAEHRRRLALLEIERQQSVTRKSATHAHTNEAIA